MLNLNVIINLISIYEIDKKKKRKKIIRIRNKASNLIETSLQVQFC